MDDYLCITILSHSNETEADFKRRLSEFWTHMLRNHEADYEKVYAETVHFEREGNTLARKYLVEADVASLLEEQMKAKGILYQPVDPDDLYTKYEAVPPEWFWIEH